MLTKSNYLKHLQCPKALWLCKKRPDLLPQEVDAARQRVFNQGYEVESYAYKLFPKGIDAQKENDFAGSIAQSKKLLQAKTPTIFQPTISAKNLFCRADIISYNSTTKQWDIYEVKSSTQDKEIHLADLAFQKICFEEAGYAIGKLNLIHVNNQYIRKGEIEPKKLLIIKDLTKEVNKLIAETKLNIKNTFKVLALKLEPKVLILNYCHYPYACDFIDYCWKNIPDESIYSIAGGLKEDKLKMLLEKGILEIKDIPEGIVTSKRGLRHYHAIKHNKAYIDSKGIKKELSQLEYPLYFLDYETFSPAIPLFDGYRPYQRIVFQYSLHVQEYPEVELKHFEFLAEDLFDPTKRLSEELKGQIDDKGSVLAWNVGFEKGCNKEMGEREKEFKNFFESVNNRAYDLMHVFRKGYYVHKNFHGSCSIKNVLPVLVPKLSYKNLNIQEGGTASESWMSLTDKKISKREKEKLAKDMLAYCELDTLAMVEILGALNKIK
jgi:hypothetical protein